MIFTSSHGLEYNDCIFDIYINQVVHKLFNFKGLTNLIDSLTGNDSCDLMPKSYERPSFFKKYHIISSKSRYGDAPPLSEDEIGLTTR